MAAVQQLYAHVGAGRRNVASAPHRVVQRVARTLHPYPYDHPHSEFTKARRLITHIMLRFSIMTSADQGEHNHECFADTFGMGLLK